MDWPVYEHRSNPILTPFDSLFLGGGGEAGAIVALGTAASGTWTVNNKAYYYPFTLRSFEIAYQLLFFVGATQAGNIDVGIYDSQKNRIVSAGSTAMSATVNTWQELNITDTTLPPGDYLLGVACSTTSGTCFTRGDTDETALPAFLVYEQTTALPLPDPCVPVICTDTTVPRWACGIQLVPTF